MLRSAPGSLGSLHTHTDHCLHATTITHLHSTESEFPEKRAIGPSAGPSLIRTGHGTHSPFASGHLFTPERKPLMEGTGSSNAKAVHSEAEAPGRAGASGRTLGSRQGSEMPAVAPGPWRAAPGSQPDARAHGSKCDATAAHQPCTPRSPGGTRVTTALRAWGLYESHEIGVTVASPLRLLLCATGLRWLLVCSRKHPE